ncbi:unnamed protein product [Didymodactylos carnosus]|uniref:Uncharacterized protein n=1 Tax=Didymodactylos carnosus TaxID=1234261 RepID=A0A813YK41_9BILA|nr:unnamed protein product [Didymodactylos carnosus]CAF1111244.1 unnamed protein product [Didymodactylos carnosus]CAF3671025.1 unnamed protein product [Didymodactylos carnosus]CAF3879087.1 unnamed protein product [Didymodactylos carnosus]
MDLSLQWKCARQLRPKEVPPRALANGLEVCTIPDELKRLNYLEKLLVALQRGTHGPLYCVSANVHETVTALPRPVAHTREALECLKSMNDNYKEIEINEIDDNYLANHPATMDRRVSADKDESETIDDRTESEVNDVVGEAMQVDNNNDYNVAYAQTAADGVGERNDSDDSVQENAADVEAGALESDSESDSDSERNRSRRYRRCKFNFSTHSCLQPTDLENYVLDQKIVSLAPAE